MYKYGEFLSAVKDCDECRSPFIKKYRRLYEYSKKVGWYENYKWKEPSKDGYVYLIYSYEDNDNRVAYVGLTHTFKRRHSEHKCQGSVFKYFSQNNKVVPDPIILEDNLTAEEAREKEEFYRNQYVNKGWVMLNKAKTGAQSSSLGGNNDKWTYDVCYLESRKYKTKSAFQKGNVSAYRKALDNGWLNSWYKNVDTKKWTREKCYEEAKKFHSRSEFRLKNQSAYNSAWKNKWLDNYHWFNKKTNPKKWTEEACLNAAKQCQSRSEMALKFSGAYKEAKQKGWIENYNWFEDTKAIMSRQSTIWTYEKCYECALKYNNRWAFGKENSGAYHACIRNHWLDSFTWFEDRQGKKPPKIAMR